MNNKLVKNTVWLYILNIAKLVFPLLTLPYLTRILSVESYGVVSYVKSFMTYMQLFVDFGFILSATKDIVKAKSKDDIGVVVGEALFGRIMLAVIGFVFILICSFTVNILKDYVAYTLISYVVVFLSAFLVDFLFRGIEKMQVLAIRFVAMKGLSTLLTFIVVKDDSDLIFIPILDVIGSVAALILTWYEVYKLKIPIKIRGIGKIFLSIKESALYFLSNASTTAFTALNTLLIGMYINSAEAAYWNVPMQLLTAVQAMYNPLAQAMYPEMIKTKSLGLVKRMIKIFFPIVLLGALFTFVFAKYILIIIAGEKYIESVPILRIFVFVMVFSFLGIILGWSTLGAIDKVKETTITTVTTAVIQILGLILLGLVDCFTLVNIAVLRAVTEGFMMAFRAAYVWKFRKLFNH